MHRRDLIDLSMTEIMSKWPGTVRVLLELRFHCVGCPIAGLHGLVEAADEHGLPLDALVAAIKGEIRRAGTTAGPAPPRRR